MATRPRDPALVREAIDEAFKAQMDRVFAIACADLAVGDRTRFVKAVNAALDLRQHALDVFVNGTKEA